MHWCLYVAITIVVIVVIICTFSLRRYTAFLSGLWVGDPDFLSSAQLQDFQLYIAPECQQGYLIISDSDGEFIANLAFDLDVAHSTISAISAATRVADIYRTNCSIICDDPIPFPTSIKIAISILNGTLTLYDDTRIYAYLIKDNQASTAADIAWQSSI